MEITSWKIDNIGDVLTLRKIYRALSFLFTLYYFLFLGSQTTSKDVFPEDGRLNFWFLGVKEAR